MAVEPLPKTIYPLSRSTAARVLIFVFMIVLRVQVLLRFESRSKFCRIDAPTPGHEHLFQTDDNSEEAQRHDRKERDGREYERGIEVVVADDDHIAKTLLAGDELGDHGADDRESNRGFEAGKQIRNRVWQTDLPELSPGFHSHGLGQVQHVAFNL